MPDWLNDVLRATAAISTALLPAIAALFLYRQAERRAAGAEAKPPVIAAGGVIASEAASREYFHLMGKLAEAVELLARNVQDHSDGDARWKGRVLEEITDARRAIQEISSQLEPPRRGGGR